MSTCETTKKKIDTILHQFLDVIQLAEHFETIFNIITYRHRLLDMHHLFSIFISGEYNICIDPRKISIMTLR